MKLGENAFSGCDLENINITFLDNKLDKEDMTNSISDTKKDKNKKRIPLVYYNNGVVMK